MSLPQKTVSYLTLQAYKKGGERLEVAENDLELQSTGVAANIICPLIDICVSKRSLFLTRKGMFSEGVNC